MAKTEKDAKKVKKGKKSKKDASSKKKKKSKKARTSSSSSEADQAAAGHSGVLAPGIAQELRAALLRKGDSAGDLCSQRDNALGRCDARVIHRPREEELTESQKAEREALQKEADDLIKQHREMRLKTSAP